MWANCDGCATCRAELRRAFHAEARHGPARGLRAGRPQGRCHRRADGRHRRAAALDGHRHRFGRHAGSRASTPRSSAASSSRRSAAAASRSADRPARSSCWSRPPWQRTAWTACCSRRCCPASSCCRDRPAAARHLHQIHPLSGDRRVHRRHRRHHLRQPDQGFARPDAPTTSRARSSPKLEALARALPTVNAAAIAVAALTIAHHPRGCAASARIGRPSSSPSRSPRRRRGCFGLPVETIGTRFGGIPQIAAAAASAGVFARRSSSRCCRRRSPSRCSAASKACSRRWSPTA